MFTVFHLIPTVLISNICLITTLNAAELAMSSVEPVRKRIRVGRMTSD